MKVLAVIPARYSSTRFPGKVLAKDTDKFLIQHTYERACLAKLPEKVLIAADGEKVLEAAKTFGADCVLTLSGHQSGTDRIAEAIVKIADSGQRIADRKKLNANCGRAICFSRSPIPYDRDKSGIGDIQQYLRHIGIYAYRKSFLLEITALPQTPLEKIEKLEQLRAIEHGYGILVGKVKHTCDGIDTPEQYVEFVRRYKGK